MKRNLHAGNPRSGGLSLNVFTEAEMDDIHFATLEVLERTGVWVEDDDALDVFADGGCRVDRETRRVKFPPHVVEEAIRSTPASLVRGARDPKHRLVLEPGRVSFCNFDEGIMVNDLRSGEHREPVLQDVAEIARLVDALDHIDMYEPAGSPTDRPQETAVLHGTEAALHNTTKPVGTESTSAWEVRKVLEMGAAVVGGMDELRENPIVGFGVCPVSPLKLPRDATELDGDVRRLLAGHARGHLRPAQRRGPRRHHAGPAHDPRHADRLRLVDDRHGPAPGGGLRRLAGARPLQRRHGADGPALPHPELRRWVVGGFEAR